MSPSPESPAGPERQSDSRGPQAGGWRPGVRLALDWGAARIGVAACDPQGVLCFPVETIPNDQHAVQRVLAVVAEHQPLEVILGLPRELSGREGIAAQRMRALAGVLARRLPVPLRLVDERMSTAAASRGLSAAGRDSRHRRDIVDQAAAVEILRQAVALELATGRPAGQLHTTEGS